MTEKDFIKVLHDLSKDKVTFAYACRSLEEFLSQQNKELLSELSKQKELIEKRTRISFEVQEENNELKKEIEKIKGEKKKEYQRTQKLVTDKLSLQEQIEALKKERDSFSDVLLKIQANSIDRHKAATTSTFELQYVESLVDKILKPETTETLSTPTKEEGREG